MQNLQHKSLMKILHNYNLIDNNTFGINAKCKMYIEFTNEQELSEGLDIVRESNDPLLIIGEGSNLLLTKDFNGIVLHSTIEGYNISEIDNGVLIKAGSGIIWDNFVEFCINNGYYGIENLSYIPGTVGASAVQNIGAYGCEAKDVIHSIEAMEIANGKKHVINNSECNYSYRNSIFKNEWKNKFVITHVTYNLSKKFIPHIDYGNIKEELTRRNYSHNPDAKQLREVIIAIRKSKLPEPNEEGNAGSFFMNPIVTQSIFNCIKKEYPEIPHYPMGNDNIKIPAGWLIEKCGWKGRTMGPAGVHDKQALVLVNKGGATGIDIVKLCEAIRHDVSTKFGITIHPEVNIL